MRLRAVITAALKKAVMAVRAVALVHIILTRPERPVQMEAMVKTLLLTISAARVKEQQPENLAKRTETFMLAAAAAVVTAAKASERLALKVAAAMVVGVAMVAMLQLAAKTQAAAAVAVPLTSIVPLAAQAVPAS